MYAPTDERRPAPDLGIVPESVPVAPSIFAAASLIAPASTMAYRR